MTPLTIEVSGTSTHSRQPDLAVMRVYVKSQGPFEKNVTSQVAAASDNLHHFFDQLSRDIPDAIASFSSTHLCTWLDNHHRQDSQRRRNLFYARLSYKVCFHRFDLLSEVVEIIKAYPRVEIHSIEWQLTEESDKALATLTRKMAMRDAILKATDFAEVVGRKVFPTKIHDSGSRRLYPPNQPSVPEGGLSAQSYRSGNLNLGNNHRHEAIDTEPEDIKYTASVEVQFTEVDSDDDDDSDDDSNDDSE
ncbi:uncharacterized protein N7483_006640 [Penicillium malachiteum]|uniref:uncharacterized protein n=1 Tax=Penicillium malachiteum TaxID=1324776 RepID=UPI0025478A06|nr:uncharacterized protein N7483_006640 [Penicillium malachiteum]KAJ5725283.1 hypothetical protein N7483_006640 [Penicillium malachiteum]